MIELGELRPGPARPARCSAVGVAAHRRARHRRRPAARADLTLKLAPGAILVLVLDREPSRARNARDADRHALTVDDVGDPAGRPVVYLHGGGDSRLSRHPGRLRSPPRSASACSRSTGAGPRARLRTLRAWAERDRSRRSTSSASASSAGRPAGRTRSRVAAVAPERVTRVALVGVDAAARRRRRACPRRARGHARRARRAAGRRARARAVGEEADAADRRPGDRRRVRARPRRVVSRAAGCGSRASSPTSAGRGASSSPTCARR